MPRVPDPGVRVAVAAPSALGESPLWHPREQVLYWCDIAGRRLNRFDPAGGSLAHWEFPAEPGSCAAHRDGSLLVAMRDGLWRLDPRTGERRRLAAPPYDPGLERFNDGKCDPLGRFWIGTIYEPRQPPLAALYCWDGHALQRRADGVTTSNGLAWSPDGGTMYWSDTTAHTVFALHFDLATGGLSQRRVFARFASRPADGGLETYGGRPDGGAVDAEGCYWAAMYEGGRLLRLSPAGEVLREVVLPVRCPTMPAFGGADLKTLYVTTARDKRPARELAEQPLAGCVLALDVDVPGLPVHLAA
jgi:sugar lactone lactonase YvrE